MRRAAVRERAAGCVAELREGIAYVRTQTWLWGTLVAASLAILFFLGPVQVLLPYVVKNRLHAGSGSSARSSRSRAPGDRDVAVGRRARAAAARGQLDDVPCGRSAGSRSWASRSASRSGCWRRRGRWGARSRSASSSGRRAWRRACRHLRGRVNSLDWFVSIGLAPVSFALTGPAARWIGVRDTLLGRGDRPRGLDARAAVPDRHARGGDARASGAVGAGPVTPRPDDLVHLVLVDGLLLEQARDERIEPAAVRAQQATVSSSALSTIRRTSASTASSVLGSGHVAGSRRPRNTGPTASLIPQRVTIERAIIVSCWMSLSAPVVTSP